MENHHKSPLNHHEFHDGLQPTLIPGGLTFQAPPYFSNPAAASSLNDLDLLHHWISGWNLSMERYVSRQKTRKCHEVSRYVSRQKWDVHGIEWIFLERKDQQFDGPTTSSGYWQSKLTKINEDTWVIPKRWQCKRHSLVNGNSVTPAILKFRVAPNTPRFGKKNVQNSSSASSTVNVTTDHYRSHFDHWFKTKTKRYIYIYIFHVNPGLIPSGKLT